MRNFYLLIVLLFSALFSSAQTTGYSGTGSNINVDNYQIYWRLNPDSASWGIKGSVKVKFRTTSANVTAITLDLRATYMIVDDANWNNGSRTVTWVGNTISIPVNIPLAGTRDSITITYHGTPPPANNQEGGFTKSTGSGVGNVIHTLSESYEDRDWWPCKADMQDKADTIDITVNVPYRTNAAALASATDTFWVASNGTLIDSTIDVSGTQAQRNRTFKYINRYPMASYLVCVGVARYNRYYRGEVDLGGGVKVPIVYYLYANKGSYTSILAAMDKATECVSLFSQKFGNYGFNDRTKGGKHGFYEGLGGGGMEHQTFSGIATLSLSSKSVLIHELMHQWFGDKVSFSTWQDLYLAEGFAEYSPIIAAENITGTGSTPLGFRTTLHDEAIKEKASAQITPAGIANSNTIWVYDNTTAGYGNSVYNRGAMVVSMLRTLCGDTKFFQIMTDYQTNVATQFKSASTNTLKGYFNTGLGFDMSEFFNDNVVGTGYPDYTIGYQYFGIGNKKLALSVVSQTRKSGNPTSAPASTVAYFNNPIVVHVKGALPANDTTIVFYDWGGGNLSKAGNGLTAAVPGNALTYQLSFAPTSIAYDDSLETMSLGTMTSLTIVDLKIVDFNARQHTGYNDASLILDDNSINATVVLERSGDGINFTDLGNMALQANSGTAKKYLFNDMSPLTKDNYYRARYKNADGIDIYSRIVKLGASPTRDFVILNNPVSDLLQVRTSDAAGKDISFNIYDASSKLVLNRQVKNASSITDINLPRMAPGVYILRIAVAREETKNLRFIVR